MSVTKEKKYIADVYSRLGALLVDTIILGCVGLLLGLIFESVFVKMGGWGQLVGVTIMLLYFGIGNSQRAGGQTLGKKLLKIRVVDRNGSPLGTGKALLRAIVLIVPFALNGQAVFGDNPSDILISLLTSIVFGGTLAIVYLFLFNRNTRQSLHDLVANSIVINIGSDKQNLLPVWKGHIVIVALLFLISAAVPAFTKDMVNNSPFQELVTVQKMLADEPKVSSVSVFKNTHTFTDTESGETVTDSLSLQVFVDSNIISDEDFAKEIARKSYSNYALAEELDVVYVTLIYGYNIAIASKSQSYSYEFKPSELVE
ncbi:RDD family protein [Psychrobacter sp.]|uniref:RDD family protein n=1 Tax=unclassified Psychrobacter TaxID=196806 RepID=UPI003F9BF3A1